MDPGPALLPACLGLQEGQGWSWAGPTREGSSGPVQCGSNTHLQGNAGQLSLLRRWCLAVSVGCWVWPTCERVLASTETARAGGTSGGAGQ